MAGRVWRWLRQASGGPALPEPVTSESETAHRAAPAARELSMAETAFRDRALAYLAAEMDPAGFARTEGRIRDELTLYPFAADPTAGSARPDALRLITGDPAMPAVMIFHADGHVREAALRWLRGPVVHPVVVWGVAVRLNDWVPEIRAAAMHAFRRVLDETPAPILAPAVRELVLRGQSWGRWQDGMTILIKGIATRPDLVSLLLEGVATDNRAGNVRILRMLARHTVIDNALPDLALHATQPHIRALVTGWLGYGRVWWQTGKLRRIWTDRSMGQYRDEPEFESRSPVIITEPAPLIEQALTDRAAAVRRQALDILTARRGEAAFRPLVHHALRTMAEDRDSAVRRKVDYLRKVRETDAPGHNISHSERIPS